MLALLQVRVRLSLLSALDLGVVLAYLTSRSPAPPSEEWLDDFLDALQSRFTHLTGGEVVGVAVMLAALPPSWAPPAAWLDALCDACSARLVLMNSTQLTRLLGSLHALRWEPCTYTPAHVT